MAADRGAAPSLEKLGAELSDKATKNKEQEQSFGVQSLESNSSIKSLGAIVFNSGTLATNVAIIKTNQGLVYRLAVAAVVINCIAIVVSTIQVSYAKPTKIRDLPSEEVGIIAIILSFFWNFFKIGDNRSNKRDNSKTTDDRIDELDSDLVGLREDLACLQDYVSAKDKEKLEKLCEQLSSVSLNQLSNQPGNVMEEVFTDGGRRPTMSRTSMPRIPSITERNEQEGGNLQIVVSPSTATPAALNPPVQEGDVGDGAHGTSMARTGSVPQPKAHPWKPKPRAGVSEEDMRIRAKLLDPIFIDGIQKAKRILAQLVLYEPDIDSEADATPTPQSKEHTPRMRRARKGCWHTSERGVCGLVQSLFACFGVLREDPYLDEDFWLKRKRIQLNLTLFDTMRKDLASRLTQSSNNWTYPLWVQQMNLIATILGLAVLVLDIVVATYAGNNPSPNVNTNKS